VTDVETATSNSKRHLNELTRSSSAPPLTRRHLCQPVLLRSFSPRELDLSHTMLSEPSFENDDWNVQPSRLYRTASVGSWGVTSIGRGFAWDENETENRLVPVDGGPPHKADPPALTAPASRSLFFDSSSDDPLPRKPSLATKTQDVAKVMRLVTNVTPPARPAPSPLLSPGLTTEPNCYSTSPATSRSPSPIVSPRPFRRSSSVMQSPATPSTPRPRRRSSQQRISLVAGRVMIAPIQQPDEPSIIPKNLSRADSSSSLLSLATSTRPPSRNESFLGDRSISDFQIDGELGRGAYGLVKRAREIKPDGSFGVRTARPRSLCVLV
jgi:protein-serine/threonine kinase